VKGRTITFGVVGVVALAAALAGAGWLALPAGKAKGQGTPVAQSERDSMLALLKPPKRARPVIAILGVNEGTEVTDYLMPHGILTRADVADVLAVATKPGIVKLYPALHVEAQAAIDDFDAKFPEGADYVIVPAMYRNDDPLALQWIRSQAAKGAIIIGVCVGVTVVAETGLLDGKRATTHWYYIDKMLKRHPTIQYVPDRRIVVDERIATTTGISASMPMSLLLIEAIAGPDKAADVARQLGLEHWGVEHHSAAFKFTRPFVAAVLGNILAFWNRERVSIELPPEVDEVSLALVADMWSRTYRSRATTFSVTNGPHRTRAGLRIVPDNTGAPSPSKDLVVAIDNSPPARVIDTTLRSIADRYGMRTANAVAMQLETPWPQ
jgi:transcriptional regulator GlxA family with amidase domain